ncbi:MAG: metallophosphoesterase [Anaerolineaceae bacterium]|jgi:Icc-related predicted phosphoesterase|nr:MAG: metallophosphoesterase [Anaerolineaceae bacterium]
MTDKILVVSDTISDQLYDPAQQKRLRDILFIISSGDLSYDYLEYLVSSFNVPLYYVRGNHAKFYETDAGVIHNHPWGCKDLHGRSLKDDSGYLLAGIQGSHVYNYGQYQYSQATMWQFVFRLIPSLMANFALSGRYLDIFVTHAPPWGIHDRRDIPHQGIKAFLWVLKVFKPLYHFHGHVYDIGKNTPMITQFGDTEIVNTYGYRIHEISYDRKMRSNLREKHEF